MFWPHQQRLRRNEENLGHDVLVVETFIEFRHIVLRRHLSLHVFEVELDLLWLQIIFPHVPEDICSNCSKAPVARKDLLLTGRNLGQGRRRPSFVK